MLSLVALCIGFYVVWRFFEIALRLHQALAGALIYALWVHIPTDNTQIEHTYYYVVIGTLGATSVIYVLVTVWRSGLFHGFAHATLVQVAAGAMVELEASRTLQVKPGQYINLWIPTLGLFSIFQSHPFFVTSFSPEKTKNLELLVVPQPGLTKKYYKHANSRRRMAFFTGPFGQSAPLSDYETVIMIATGSGIAAQIPYMFQLIQDHEDGRRVGRTRIVWEAGRKYLASMVDRM